MWWNPCHLFWKLPAMVVINGKYIISLSLSDRQNWWRKSTRQKLFCSLSLRKLSTSLLMTIHEWILSFFRESILISFPSRSQRSVTMSSRTGPILVMLRRSPFSWDLSSLRGVSCNSHKKNQRRRKLLMIEKILEIFILLLVLPHQGFPGLDDSRLDTYSPMELVMPKLYPPTQQVFWCIVDNELRLVEEVPNTNPRRLRKCWGDWRW